VVLLYLQYGIYDSPAPSTFVRSVSPTISFKKVLTPQPSENDNFSCQIEDCLTIVLTSQIGQGASGVVLRGTLKVEASDGCILLDVAVKIALTIMQQEELRNEYENYRLLQLKGISSGITTPLGFFEDHDCGPYALVLPYAGVPLDSVPNQTLPSSHRYVGFETQVIN
jgi:hypothetical protein